ncbi:uncharacterized protein LOC131939938 [Physella acuta]|uniref:uncharacterized protein LOC131939938 n=1 Tax=Physella acuta TaxID=109671 RepID=UPI0027DC633D|nr:uncharacterized protein LOC131939938 [Physella acuta]
MTNSLLTVACTLFMFGAGQVCVPCEENTRCEIAYAFQYTGIGLYQLIWSIGGIDAVVCHTRNGNECELYPDFKGVVFSKIEKQSDFMTTNIQFTADRNNQLLTAKKWELVYSSTVVYTCDVHYYKKIDQAMCHHKISKKGLHIECTSANVYPKSCCNFSVKVNRASWDIQLTPEYNRTVVKTDPVYFDTVCALDIAPADLESGVWEVNVTMYPDIFNDDGKNCKPTNGGKTFLFNITIEHPFISLYNCPNAVEDGKEFNCICQRDDKSDVHTVVYWKKQGANRSNNNISAVLIATAKKEETGEFELSSMFGIHF